MKISNKTHYRTSDLRKIFTQVKRLSNKIEGKCSNYKRLVVEVVYSRGGGCSAWAFIDGFRMRIRIPKDPKGWKGQDLAFYFDHELQHIRGYRHAEMQRGWNDGDYLWANAYEVRLKEVKPRQAVNLQAKRYQHAIKKLIAWQKKIKIATKRIKRWKQKVKYYEKIFASAKRGE